MASHFRSRDAEQLRPAALQVLRDVAGLWAAERGSEALDLLEASSTASSPAAGLSESLAQHIARVLIWLDPNEPWVRSSVADLLQAGVVNPAQCERSVVSLAARVFEERPDGNTAA